MAEPLGVAFVEVEPISTGFRAKTEALVRGQLAGVAGTTRAAAVAQTQLTEAEVAGTRSARAKAVAEGQAAAATRAHATAALHAQEAILAESTSILGLRGHSLGLNTAFVGTTAAVIALFKSLEEASEVEEQMHLIEVATHATAAELRNARAEAVALGRDQTLPLTTAREAATAINFLARSGFDLKDSMTAARGALLLAAASGEDLESSVREVDRILDAFNLTAADSEKVADAVATGLKFTQGNATEFAQALATVAPAADLMGLSLEETNTLVLQLAESGLSAGQAAGSLRQALLRLATATGAQGAQIREALKSINLEVSDLIDQQGDLRPDAFVRLAESLDNVSEKQQKAILIQIFTRRAALGVLRIIQQQREGYERMGEAARESGVAQEQAAARARSFGGQTAELRDDVSDLGLKLGHVATGPATLFVRELRGIARQADRAATAIDFLATEVDIIGLSWVGAIPQGERFLQLLKDIAGLQRDPIGGALDFLKQIPGEVSDAAQGLQQAINLNVGGIRDIPGIQELADNLGILVGAWEKGRKGVKTNIDQMNEDAKNGMDTLDRTTRDGANKVAGNLGKLSLAVIEAQVSGDQSAELAALRQRRAAHQNLFNRLDATARKSPTKEHIAAAERAANLLEQDDAAIQAILNDRESAATQAASNAQASADRIQRAADERDRNFISAIESRRAGREGAVTAAGQTEQTLRDDIRANVKLRNFLRNAIENTRARIREARAAGRETEALAAELASLRQARNQVRREIERLQADAAAQAAETRVESAQLDLQILETRVGDDPTRGQTNKLIAAHQKVIAALKRAQKLAKGRTLEVKRLQLEIEQEKAAIRDLRKSQASATSTDTQNFLRQQFEFLQTIHGFSSNLLGNLIPGSALGGLVGGTATSSTLGRPAGLAVPGGAGTRPTAGISTKPVSAGQGNRQIQLLQEIRNLLKSEHGRGDHPEVHLARRKGAAAGDFSYQGTHGG